MHPATRARIVALVLGVAAVACFALTFYGQGIVLAAVAAGIAILVPDRSVTRQVAAALADHQAVQDAAEAMRLQGRGIMVPHAPAPLLFIPAQDAKPADAPRFDGRTRVVARPPVGLFLTPPGAGLFTTWSQHAGGPPGGGLEGATRALAKALPALGLGRDVHVERGEHVRITYQSHLPGSDPAHAWHLQGGDAVASFVAMVLCAATGRPVKLIARDDVERGHRTTWEVA